MSAKLALVLIGTTLVTACTGGGNNLGDASSSETIFSPFIKDSTDSASQLARESRTITNAQTQEVTYTYDVANGLVTGMGTPSSVKTTGSVSETYNADGDVTSISVTSSEGTITSYGAGDTGASFELYENLSVAEKSDKSETMIYFNSEGLPGYDNHNFGVWKNEVIKGSPTIGVVSAGLAADPAVVPTSGAVRYFFGKTIGYYVGTTLFFVKSDLLMAADFSAGTIQFQTSNAVVSSPIHPTPAHPSFNLSGTLVISGNKFTGPISNGASLSGTATGALIGNSIEAGGTFLLREAGKNAYSASFGAISP